MSMYEIILNLKNDKGIKGIIDKSLGGSLNVNIPNNELNYEIENNNVPILLQKIPGFVNIAKLVYEAEMSLFQIKRKEDVILYASGVIYSYILNNSKNFIDIELFFELLEDFLILFMDIKEIETIINSKRFKKDKKLKLLKKFEYLNNLYKLVKNEDVNLKDHIVENMFVHRSEMDMVSFQNLLKPLNYYKLKDKIVLKK